METMKTMKVNEIMEMVGNGNLIREAFQRTPSHDKKFATGIIETLLNGGDVNIITLAETENSKLSILDGSSRIADITNFVNGDLTLTETATEIYTNSKGETLEKSTKIEKSFSDFSDDKKQQFLNTIINCRILQDLDINGRYNKFLQLNNSTSLSNVQKVKGLSNPVIDDLESYLKSKPFINKLFTKRLQQKDEIYNLSTLIIANLTNNYNSSYTKLVNAIKEIKTDDIDANKLYNIIDKINDAIITNDVDCAFNKYNIIHLVVALYNNFDNVADIEINNLLFPSIETAGANSVTKNNDRQTAVDKALAKVIKQQSKASKTIKEINIDELVK